jgi:hypothetical protein
MRKWLPFFLILTGLLIWIGRTPEIPPEPPEQQAEQVVNGFGFGNSRSSHWATLRDQFVDVYSQCAACGSTLDLNVHHIKSVRRYPELELEFTNLITLCRVHHFQIGHNRNWKNENPNCVQDVREYRRLHPWE